MKPPLRTTLAALNVLLTFLWLACGAANGQQNQVPQGGTGTIATSNFDQNLGNAVWVVLYSGSTIATNLQPNGWSVGAEAALAGPRA